MIGGGVFYLFVRVDPLLVLLALIFSSLFVDVVYICRYSLHLTTI